MNMATLNVMGDALQIKSRLTKADIERVLTFKPEALKIKDEDNNEIFAVAIGNASISQYGVCFPSTDAEGRVFVTADNNIDHSDPDAEKEYIVKNFATILDKIDQIESQVNLVSDELKTIEDRVIGNIHINDEEVKRSEA